MSELKEFRELRVSIIFEKDEASSGTILHMEVTSSDFRHIQTDFFRIKIYSIEKKCVEWNIFIQLFSVVKFGLPFVSEIV